MSPNHRLLRIIEEYVVEDDMTPWWTEIGEVDLEAAEDVGFMEPDDLRRIGLSEELIRDGQDWNREWDAWAMATMDLEHNGPTAAGEALHRRGVELAKRSVEEVPSLWVLDPDHDWHVGADQLTYPGVLAVTWDACLLLGVPADSDDDWPWWFEPAGSTPDGAWRVPLPRDLGWGSHVEETTAAYVEAFRAAATSGAMEEALRLARQAVQTMAGTVWKIKGLRVRDFTNREWLLSESMPRNSRLDHELQTALTRLMKESPAPPRPEKGEWFAYAPLSGETLEP
ncbi:hypothetical protein [Galactobacter sp.]|uniref:hypothetical protein n=1 Tax=Galactobacter sp. TaxID=2676125 RepID=UPI0025B8DD85|nr:hypothetical protein [Galactobacter sp.]